MQNHKVLQHGETAMSELARLIAEQERDDRTGHRINTSTISLDSFPSGVDAPKPRGFATDIRHGTLYCYVRLRCRCAKCRTASAAYARERRLKLRRRP